MPSPQYLAMRAYHHWRLLGGRLRGGRNRWRGVRILGYHRVAKSPGPLSVPPAAFERQMDMVLESGARPVSVERAVEMLSSQVDGQYVSVTFDDGYLDNLEHGEPILRARGIPATIFLPTAIIDRRLDYFWLDPAPPALSWEHIRQATARGSITFQSHGDTHSWLPDLSDEDALYEFTESKAQIERHTGSSVTIVAFPGGLYGAREEQLLRRAGYRAGVSTDRGVNTGTHNLMALKRTLIYSDDGPSDFAAKLSGLLDRPGWLRRLLYDRLGPSRRTPAPQQSISRARAAARRDR